MQYYTIQPPPSLSTYVRYFWVLEGEASLDRPYVHRSMADGCAELLFHYQGVFDELFVSASTEKSFSAGLAGPSQRHRRFFIQQPFGIFGVYLYPFAVAQLFSLPSVETRNQMLDLQTLLGSEGTELEERMMLAPDNVARVCIISSFLEKKQQQVTRKAPGVFEMIHSIIQTKGEARIEELSRQSFLSTRQFERSFKHYAGFSPKLFSRIIRFQAALGMYPHKDKSLTEIAHACGYYDQSHFIQDFKEFSGHNPKEYFSGRTEATEWRG